MNPTTALKTVPSRKLIIVLSSVVGILAVSVISGIAILLMSEKDDNPSGNNQQNGLISTSSTFTGNPSQFFSSSSAPTVNNFKFQRFPFDIKDIGSVAPIGEFAGISRSNVMNSHFYGNMRHYVFSKEPGKKAYNVYVPADGKITGFRNNEMTGEFRFNFDIDGRSFYYLDHIQSLSDEMKSKLAPYFGSPLRFTNAVEMVSPGIEVKAGDVIGQTGLKGIAWDWGFIDDRACTGILFPEHYKQDRCPTSAYEFFTAEMKEQIKPLAGYWSVDPNSGVANMQSVKAQAILGEYGHDVKGALSGGWFYSTNQDESYKNAFLNPDSYEPNMLQIRLGIPELSLLGIWNRIPIGDKVNPDPKTVTVEDGIVVYTLGQSNRRDTMEYGILLARVNSDDSITVETFPNETAAPANPQFSAKAITLKR